MNPLDNENIINTNQNPQQITDQNPQQPNNQMLQQVNDRYLYPTMKQVKEIKEGKFYKDAMPDVKLEEEKIEEEERLQKEKEEKENEELLQKEEEEEERKRKEEEEKPSTIHNEFKNLFNKNVITNNRTRKFLLSFIIFNIVFLCIAWEGLCLYGNLCYGESIHMKGWISHTLCPLIFILIIFNIFLFFSINYLSRIAMRVFIIFNSIFTIASIVIAVLTIIYGVIKKIDDQRYYELTPNSKNFYHQNDEEKGIKNLKNYYRKSMLITFIILVVIIVLMIIIILISVNFYFVVTQTVFDWRPPLRSRLHIDREQRIINYHVKYNEEYRKLYQAEHPNGIQEPIVNNIQERNEYDELPRKKEENDFNERNELPQISNQQKEKNKNLQNQNQTNENYNSNDNLNNNQNNINNENQINNQNNINNQNENELNHDLPQPSLQPRRRRLPPMKRNDDDEQ